ncbi:unnamed protein product, partial [Closterium sp. NIES-64]
MTHNHQVRCMYVPAVPQPHHHPPPPFIPSSLLPIRFPQLRVVAVSANKVIGVMGNARGAISTAGFALSRLGAALPARQAIVLALSQSGQTFPTLHATRILAKHCPGRVFVCTGMLDCKMATAVGLSLAAASAAGSDGAWCARVLHTHAGWRSAEPATVSAVACHATLTELLLHAARTLRSNADSAKLATELGAQTATGVGAGKGAGGTTGGEGGAGGGSDGVARRWVERPLGLRLSGGDVADLERMRDAVVMKSAPDIVGWTPRGHRVHSPVNSALRTQGLLVGAGGDGGCRGGWWVQGGMVGAGGDGGCRGGWWAQGGMVGAGGDGGRRGGWWVQGGMVGAGGDGGCRGRQRHAPSSPFTSTPEDAHNLASTSLPRSSLPPSVAPRVVGAARVGDAHGMGHQLALRQPKHAPNLATTTLSPLPPTPLVLPPQWALHVLETPMAWAISSLYIFIAVVHHSSRRATLHTARIGRPPLLLLPAPRLSASELPPFPPISPPSPGTTAADALLYTARALDALLFCFLPLIIALPLRILTGRDLLARLGKRTVVIADVPWVHQSLEVYVSKLFALSYWVAGLDVHGASPIDHLVHRFTHRVCRGTLLAFGRPDGRLCSQSRCESWVLMALLQARTIVSLGCGAEVITVGHNPYHARSLVKRHVVLPSNRPKFLCEKLLGVDDLEPMKRMATREHVVSTTTGKNLFETLDSQ